MEKIKTPVQIFLEIENNWLKDCIKDQTKFKHGQVEWHVNQYNILKYQHTIEVLKELSLHEKGRILRDYLAGSKSCYYTLEGDIILKISPEQYLSDKYEKY